LNFYNPGNCFVDLPGFGDVSVSLPFVCGEIEGTLDVTYAAFDDDADGLTDALDPDCATADDDSEYHLSSGDILAVSYELPAALYRVDPASGARTTLMSIELDTPWGVATGPAGQVFVSDAGSEAILELDPSDGSVRVVSSWGALDFPRGLMDESDGKILVADRDAQEVFRIDPVTGSQTGITTGGTCDAILEPRVLEPSSSPGNVAYVTDGSNGHVYEIVLDNLCAQRSNGIAITNPWGLVVEDDGHLLVVDSTSKEVVRFNPSVLTETELHTSMWNFNVPRGMTFEADGKLLLADYGENLQLCQSVKEGTIVA
jgi:DNA-binding beta-propeller fold protein YncE